MGRPGSALNFAADPESYLDFSDQTRNFISLLKGDLNERFKLVGQLIDANEIDGVKETLIVWRRLLRDLLLIKSGVENFVSNLYFLPELKLAADNYELSDLINLVSEVNSAKSYLDANANPKLTLENLILNF